MLRADIKKVKIPENININDILKVFPPSARKSLDVSIEGNFALLVLKGKFDKKKFKKILDEVQGYGGRWVKGHFVLPLATIGLGEEE